MRPEEEEYNNKFFSFSFIRQMTELAAEIERTLKNKNVVQKTGRDMYGKLGTYTFNVFNLFNIIRADPKNSPYITLLNEAESTLLNYLYSEEFSLSTENRLKNFWENYTHMYMDELEKKQ